MKKILLSVLAVATLAVTPTMAEDVAITAQQLPKAAQQFLKSNFAKSKVVAAMHDRDISDNDYTVLLDNGIKVEFDANGKWESVKSKSGRVPAEIIPAAINSYLAQHYPSLGVEKIERKRAGYEVELANDLDLKFDANGKFLRIDD